MTQVDGKTHEIFIYANSKHQRCKEGTLLARIWYRGETSMTMELSATLNRPDIAYVDVLDCETNELKRWYPPTCL